MEIPKIEFEGTTTTVRWGSIPTTPDEEDARFRCSLLWWILVSAHPKAVMIRELIASPEILDIIIHEYEKGEIIKNDQKTE